LKELPSRGGYVLRIRELGRESEGGREGKIRGLQSVLALISPDRPRVSGGGREGEGLGNLVKEKCNAAKWKEMGAGA